MDSEKVKMMETQTVRKMAKRMVTWKEKHWHSDFVMAKQTHLVIDLVKQKATHSD